MRYHPYTGDGFHHVHVIRNHNNKNDINFLLLQLQTQDIVKINKRIRLHRFVSLTFSPCYIIQLHESKLGYMSLFIRVF